MSILRIKSADNKVISINVDGNGLDNDPYILTLVNDEVGLSMSNLRVHDADNKVVHLKAVGTGQPSDPKKVVIKLDSNGATDGQVLTADGAGNTNWETPSGGGGSSEIFDGAIITPGTFIENSGNIEVEIELTKGGASIASGIAWFGCVVHPSDVPLSDPGSLGGTPISVRNNNTVAVFVGNIEAIPYLYGAQIISESVAGQIKTSVTINNATLSSVEVKICVMLPNGGGVESDPFYVPGAAAPPG